MPDSVSPKIKPSAPRISYIPKPMKADIPSDLSKDGTDGLGAIAFVLKESRVDRTVENTGSDDYPLDEDEKSDDYDSEDTEHFHANKHNYEIDPFGVITESVNEYLQMMKENFEDSIHKVEKDLYSK
ncbi:hypothetical protein BDD12DRAFT_874959 [Trichophaea hybrida]|nr:hypothetical protein BDD12DRAFT_874959 [Trichophaea hybrida]